MSLFFLQIQNAFIVITLRICLLLTTFEITLMLPNFFPCSSVRHCSATERKVEVLGFVNPNLHELSKQEKCSSLAPPRSTFYKIQRAWQGVKLTRLM